MYSFELRKLLWKHRYELDQLKPLRRLIEELLQGNPDECRAFLAFYFDLFRIGEIARDMEIRPSRVTALRDSASQILTVPKTFRALSRLLPQVQKY